uniref:Uncharacterized protein n=1 Tax=Acrobeloides nanus TaxID=290746 RepID=A0A914D1H0_9BILA
MSKITVRVLFAQITRLKFNAEKEVRSVMSKTNVLVLFAQITRLKFNAEKEVRSVMSKITVRVLFAQITRLKFNAEVRYDRNLKIPFRKKSVRSNPKFRNDRSCTYKDGYIYENGHSRAQTRQEKARLDEFNRKLADYNGRVKQSSRTFTRDMTERIFQEDVTMAPWPQMPDLPCFCDSCQNIKFES